MNEITLDKPQNGVTDSRPVQDYGALFGCLFRQYGTAAIFLLLVVVASFQSDAFLIGGASLMGGRDGVINTFIGVMILGAIGNIMNLAGGPGYHQQVYLGLIIVIAVVLQNGNQLCSRR